MSQALLVNRNCNIPNCFGFENHFAFDTLIFLLGYPISSRIEYQDSNTVKGYTYFNKDIKVVWDLSIKVFKNKQKIIRQIEINNKKFFLNNDGNKDLHVKSYKEILNNRGIKYEQVKNPLKLIFKMQKNYDRFLRFKNSK